MQVGDRVRVTSLDGNKTTTGKVVLQETNALQVRESSGITYSIRYGETGRLERSVCRRCHATAGSFIGAGVGGATAIFLGQRFDCEGSCLQGFDAVWLTGIGAGAGALLGLAIGAFAPAEEWETVPLDEAFGSSLHLGVFKARDGALTFAVRLGG